MRYSIEPRDPIYFKGYGVLSFAKNMGSKYEQKRLDTKKKLKTNSLKCLNEDF